MGPVTSFIAALVASRDDTPLSAINLDAFSTTIIASSTTRPIARTRPKRVRVFIEKPRALINANVPISETGIVIAGMSVALIF